MQLVFDSLTGNVRRLVGRVARQVGGVAVLDLRRDRPEGDFLLLTYTFHRGAVPDSTRAFLARHSHRLLGVVASGSYHWGEHFARAADLIAEEYHVPVVAKVNKSGTDADVARIARWVQNRQKLASPFPLPPFPEDLWNPGSN
ncbi:class Ib ribonucleoside-diphosphate reductase assembly flavoprotein NrdI [Deinococcus metallilatus]|uniref:Class Ib ribonucleoside-diphosphate reductase assembly flavoprotein NrdI n=1 Tax=Deinococcus metallilatus TaxID=1211322 RepID=A0AAJ5K0K8_9DEIO|nr:class Ib ribonucleoside-diphosphate reductase assembly flavoprotein NrdI [Deinococcus metallilatus]MBB5294735.1 protein involved in ribonucleotide reduction [Deinococcus metallilatus]QBY09533.1 class Ib ribonucleoside-diphosphate reductase assembly flavoprotein NrdI [Deinococcus metallilatus]RXJ09538.1 class Ib ribonucleoside-diphosphate reductase assembly flavoprotein NrdI [Deinococcus metallilatus]TLK29060.1 class Ib ribonucleoside-diphosphate reductase assembly flavoprotein NrdI [Deinococ